MPEPGFAEEVIAKFTNTTAIDVELSFDVDVHEIVEKETTIAVTFRHSGLFDADYEGEDAYETVVIPAKNKDIVRQYLCLFEADKALKQAEDRIQSIANACDQMLKTSITFGSGEGRNRTLMMDVRLRVMESRIDYEIDQMLDSLNDYREYVADMAREMMISAEEEYQKLKLLLNIEE